MSHHHQQQQQRQQQVAGWVELQVPLQQQQQQ
jgi:hypothetical protein